MPKVTLKAVLGTLRASCYWSSFELTYQVVFVNIAGMTYTNSKQTKQIEHRETTLLKQFRVKAIAGDWRGSRLVLKPILAKLAWELRNHPAPVVNQEDWQDEQFYPRNSFIEMKSGCDLLRCR